MDLVFKPRRVTFATGYSGWDSDGDTNSTWAIHGVARMYRRWIGYGPPLDWELPPDDQPERHVKRTPLRAIVNLVRASEWHAFVDRWHAMRTGVLRDGMDADTRALLAAITQKAKKDGRVYLSYDEKEADCVREYGGSRDASLSIGAAVPDQHYPVVMDALRVALRLTFPPTKVRLC